MKAYKITVLAIDLENVGIEFLKYEIENMDYFSSSLMKFECADIAQLTDEHPLNQKATRATREAEFERLFK